MRPESGGSRNRWTFCISSNDTPSSEAKPPWTTKIWKEEEEEEEEEEERGEGGA